VPNKAENYEKKLLVNSAVSVDGAILFLGQSAKSAWADIASTLSGKYGSAYGARNRINSL
jgi:hypothetical protein